MKKAFTFVEILLVLLIIGIIYLLVIFVFKDKVINIDRTTRVKKTYITLVNSYKMVTLKKGSIIDWSEVTSKVLEENLSEYLYVNENCKNAVLYTGNICIPDCPNLYKTNKDTVNTCESDKVSKFRTTDGVSYAFHIEDPSCSISALGENNSQKRSVLKYICGTAVIDIHSGLNSLNYYGADLHLFYITRDGFFPVGLIDDEIFPYDEEKCQNKITEDVIGCSAKIIFEHDLE